MTCICIYAAIMRHEVRKVHVNWFCFISIRIKVKCKKNDMYSIDFYKWLSKEKENCWTVDQNSLKFSEIYQLAA